MELTAAASTPVVVLGASNVSRGLARLATIVRSRVGGPVELFVAAGHGRGYAVTTRVGSRRLPSILAGGLWRALDRERVERPLVLVTDVGNELLYGLGVATVAAAVREAVGRLADRGGRLAVTSLPVASVAGVGPIRYRLLKTLYVPGCPLALDGLGESVAALDERIRTIAAGAGAVVVDQPGSWYGFDALHVRRRHLDDLFHAAGDAWGLPPSDASTRAGWRDWAVLGSQAPEVRSLARRVRFTRQPAVARHDLRLWLY